MENPSEAYSPENWIWKVLEDGTIWNNAQSVDMPAFLSEYTLHDSMWLGFWLEPQWGQATAIIRWDSVWSRERIPYPGSLVTTWPILLVQFQGIFRLTFDGSWSALTSDFDNHIDGAESRLLSEQETIDIAESLEQIIRKQHLDYAKPESLFDEKLYFTSIEGSMADPMEFTHRGMYGCYASTHREHLW